MGDNANGRNGSLTKGLISWAVKGVLYKIFVGSVLMLSAGRWDWIAGWIYVAIFLAFDGATALVIIPRSPELLIERSRRNQDVKSWDKVIMPAAAGLLPLFSWIVAGLDQRYGWWPEVRLSLQAAGLFVTVIGHAIVVWAMSSNKYFSVFVRIQEERGHSVAAGGPYRWVRHPGYLGAILFSGAIPFLLGSWWALIPGLGSMILYVIRTDLEDKTLQDELPGFIDYAQSVRFKLIPGVW